MASAPSSRWPSALERHDTIGVDVVNACVNDIIVTGADPLFFLDYLAIGDLRADIVEEIVGGVAAGCAAAGIPLVGGETAQMPDLYRDADYDLAGFIVGVVSRADLIDGSRARAGNVVIGLPSSGLHTNGYSLARRVLPESSWRKPMPDNGQTVGEALLEPHRSYLDEVARPASGVARRRQRHLRHRAHHRRGMGGKPAAHVAGGARRRDRDWLVADSGDLQPHPVQRRHRRRGDGPHLQRRDRPDGGGPGQPRRCRPRRRRLRVRDRPGRPRSRG